MKMNFSKESIANFLKKQLNFIVFGVAFLILAWTGYFSYQALYPTVINPKEIEKTEITAKKQKVDLPLFTAISEAADDKKNISAEWLANIDNPF